MNKSLESYFDNTKQLHLLLTISLLIIIITIGIPNGYKYTKGIGQGIVISILSYILYKNYNETRNFQLIQQDMKNKKNTIKKNANSDNANDNGDNGDDDDDNDKGDMIDMRNNTLASYTLCGFIGLLLLYFLYSIFV
jgi:hypothetical protein